uniref:Elongin A n=1 Tax=Gadus morhua TaxID=8049 RepID=A0A8C4ZEG3_GADMO
MLSNVLIFIIKIFRCLSQLLKTLRRLGELPMTVEILVDTGVGKTVNSFRKHELAGEVAKGLVAKWKKLVPQPVEEEMEERQQRRHREEEMVTEEEEEEPGYSRGYSPSPPPQHHQHSPPRHERYSPQPRGGGYRSDEYDDSPQPSPPPVAPSPPPPVRGRDAPRHGKPHKGPGGAAPAQPPQATRGSHGDRRDRERVEERPQKKRVVEAEWSPGGGAKTAKHSRHATPPEGKREKERGEREEREERKKGGVVEAVPAMPDFPLPAIQPNYRPLPSLDPQPLSPQRRKVPQANGEDESGFTGKRFNSKMTVYSGTKTAYLPKMMSLYEQCLRVLQNNIDSIDEVGGVPFLILEPVLERCTPEQLYRIEECNSCFIADSDDLWLRHCQRDFRRSAPDEYESWREMYLRLHDEREERLRMLTQNISSAHANKPKGRQVKMAFVNSVAKPPRDVRRRQEKFGTLSTSTARSAAAAAPIKSVPHPPIHPTHTPHLPHPPTHPTHPTYPPTHTYFSPCLVEIAPMMAKTIKAFKNRFSRR